MVLDFLTFKVDSMDNKSKVNNVMLQIDTY